MAFRQASAGELPFTDDTFDAVFAHSMLETLAHPLPALAEMRRVLRPGGLVGVASVEYGGVISRARRPPRCAASTRSASGCGSSAATRRTAAASCAGC